MDAVIIAAGHRQFQEMGVSEVRGLLNDHPVLVDVKGIVDRGEAEGMGIRYGKL